MLARVVNRTCEPLEECAPLRDPFSEVAATMSFEPSESGRGKRGTRNPVEVKLSSTGLDTSGLTVGAMSGVCGGGRGAFRAS
jgi:hypothetical protein